MQSIAKDPILEFPPETLQSVRKLYDLDKPGKMDEAIDLLDDWIKKQHHFNKKDFNRDYLEAIIISSKGSVERAKQRLDKYCTMKTLLPKFFEKLNVREFKEYINAFEYGALPKFTEDFYRVLVVKAHKSTITASMVVDAYRFTFILAEYLRVHDYFTGIVAILDYRDLNIVEFVSKINPIEIGHVVNLVMNGFGWRVKGIHIITPSKMVDAFVTLLKQVLSAKVGSRIQVHKTIDPLLEILPKNILPVEYGGEEESFTKLFDKWLDVLSSKEHIDFMTKMKEASTNEAYRDRAEFKDEYLGLPGTFKTLNVD